jgi:site-specific recombinase
MGTVGLIIGFVLARYGVSKIGLVVIILSYELFCVLATRAIENRRKSL